MRYLEKALCAVRTAEKQLKELLAQAAADSQYHEIPAIAEMAKKLADLHGGNHSRSQSVSDLPIGGNKSTLQRIDTASIPSAVGRRKSAYPRFEIDKDRLVKLGWSSKDNRIYEHRVVHSIAVEICNQLAEKATAHKPFKMEKLFPMRLEAGDEIPTYQAYLVLKWLQQFDVVERRGKDGYVFIDEHFAADVVEDLWTRTPRRNKGRIR